MADDAERAWWQDALEQANAERDALKAELAEIKRITESPTDGSVDLPDDPAEARELWEFVNRQTRWQYHMAHKFAGQVGGLRAELAEARAAIERAKAIHTPEQYHDELAPWCTYCNRDDNTRDDVVLWPCPTVAAFEAPSGDRS